MSKKKRKKPGIEEGIIPALTGKHAEELLPEEVQQVGRQIKSWMSKIYPSIEDPYAEKSDKRRAR